MATTLPIFDFDQVLPGRFHMPARMTALPLGSGDIALVSPIPIDDGLAGRVSELGEVKFLIAPSLLHHLYLAAAIDRWPRATVLAPASLRAKRADLRIDRALEEGLPAELAASVQALKIEGAPSVDEFAFLHAGSRTLVVTDVVFNVLRPSGWMASVLLFLAGCHGRLAQSRAWRFFIKDRAAAAASARAILALHFDALVPAHGDVVTEDARERLEVALAWMLAGEALVRRSATDP